MIVSFQKEISIFAKHLHLFPPTMHWTISYSPATAYADRDAQVSLFKEGIIEAAYFSLIWHSHSTIKTYLITMFSTNANKAQLKF